MRETKRSDDSFTALHHLKEEMESKEGELLALKNEVQGSTALKAEMDSQHGEILALQDKLQGATTALLDFQNRSRENFAEQQQELELYKTKMTELQCEKEAQHDRIHSGGYGTGLLQVDLTESGQHACWYVMTAEEPELQGETQFTETQVEVTQIEQRAREYVLNAGEPADEERHGTESATVPEDARNKLRAILDGTPRPIFHVRGRSPMIAEQHLHHMIAEQFV